MKSARSQTTRTARSSTRSTTRTAKADISARFQKVKDVHHPRSWLIYGRAGSGKTTLASTFPGPALLIDIKDQGTDSVSDVKGMEVLEAEAWQDLEDVYWYLYENPGKFKSVFIDTITQGQQLIIEEISETKKLKKNQSPGDWGTMTKQDWGEVSSKLKSWITKMRDLPLEVVFLAQDRVFNGGDDDSDEGILDPEIGPRLSPSTASHLCAAVHMVGNTFIRSRIIKRKDPKTKKTIEKEVKEYCLRLGPSSYYITKIRKPKDVEVPDFLVDPTYDDIIEIISGE